MIKGELRKESSGEREEETRHWVLGHLVMVVVVEVVGGAEWFHSRHMTAS